MIALKFKPATSRLDYAGCKDPLIMYKSTVNVLI